MSQNDKSMNTLSVRTLVQTLDALAESGHRTQLRHLFEQAGKSNKAYRFLKPDTKNILMQCQSIQQE